MRDELLLINTTESFIESVASDVVTFTALGLCIYISQGNLWWTFVTGFMFIMTVAVRMGSVFRERSNTFKSYTELRLWAEEQERYETGE